MKYLIISLVCLAALATACSDKYDDSTLTQRIDQIEQQQEINTQQIEALKESIDEIQQRIDNLDSITAVTPIYDEDQTTILGYTISFSKSDDITLLNGVKGDTGEEGQDGKDGKDGKDGEDGEDGEDAPQFTITTNQDNTITITLIDASDSANNISYTLPLAEVPSFSIAGGNDTKVLTSIENYITIESLPESYTLIAEVASFDGAMGVGGETRTSVSSSWDVTVVENNIVIIPNYIASDYSGVIDISLIEDGQRETISLPFTYSIADISDYTLANFPAYTTRWIAGGEFDEDNLSSFATALASAYDNPIELTLSQATEIPEDALNGVSKLGSIYAPEVVYARKNSMSNNLLESVTLPKCISLASEVFRESTIVMEGTLEIATASGATISWLADDIFGSGVTSLPDTTLVIGSSNSQYINGNTLSFGSKSYTFGTIKIVDNE